MHQDVVDLNAFYLTRLGRVARRILGQQIRRVWPSVREESVLGLGYPVPYLGLFREEAERVLAVMPAGQGVMTWPDSGGRLVALADDGVLPLPDGCIDRILIVHGLEFSEQRRAMLEEVWRVMRPNGRILVLVPNRHGLWARAEATPFGHGSPFSASQLGRPPAGARLRAGGLRRHAVLAPHGLARGDAYRRYLATPGPPSRAPLRRHRLRGSRQDRVRGPPGDGPPPAPGHHAAAAAGAGGRANRRREWLRARPSLMDARQAATAARRSCGAPASRALRASRATAPAVGRLP